MKTDLKQLVRTAAKELVSADDAVGDVYEILKKVTGYTRTDVLLKNDAELSEEQLSEFNSLVKKRATGYPLQYILGEWDFCGNTFFVNDGVLIPRAETEELVYKACEFLETKHNKVIFDLCCGTGCIGLSVAVNNPDCNVFLFDIEDAAIALTQKNAEKLNLKNVQIIKYDIFGGFYSDLPKPDVILSNPPYVTKEEYETLQSEIFYEPENAIVALDDALGFYRCICEKWLPNLNENSFFMFESGEEQPPEIIKILNKSQNFNASLFKTECCNDIFGTCRFVKGEYYVI